MAIAQKIVKTIETATPMATLVFVGMDLESPKSRDPTVAASTGGGTGAGAAEG